MSMEKSFPEEEALNELLNAVAPMNMVGACHVVARYVLVLCQEWSDRFAETNRACQFATGEKVTPVDPFFGGLILAVIQVIMEPANAEGLRDMAENLRLPPEAREGVRAKLNDLFDRLGLRDDRHLFN